MNQFSFYVIQFVRFFLVPLFLLIITGRAWALANVESSSPSNPRKNAFWLGCAIFILIVIVNLITQPPAFTNLGIGINILSISSGVIALNIIIGIVLGFAGLAIIRLFDESVAASIVITVMAGASLSALYYFFFVQSATIPLLLITPSLIIGALAYTVFFPKK